MRILLLGVDPGLRWVQECIAATVLSAEKTTALEVITISEQPTSRLLALNLAQPIDLLILVDHYQCIDDQNWSNAPTNEIVRAYAQHAILALELARVSVKTLILRRQESATWPDDLSSLLPIKLQPKTDVSTLSFIENREIPSSPVLNGYLRPLFENVGRFPLPMLVWPREFFLDGDVPGQTLPASIEVAGRARILAYGPYLPLPSGNWRARAFLGFSSDIGKMPFILEADCGTSISRGFFEVDRGGIFTLDLEFQVSDSMHPVELRLISQDSALEGQTALIKVELQQMATE